MVKIDGVSQMVVVLIHIEKSCLVVGKFDDLVSPAFVLIFVTIRFLPLLFALIRPQHKKRPRLSFMSYTLL